MTQAKKDLNQGSITGNGEKPEKETEKRGLIDKIQSGYHKFRSTKVGKWTVRVGKTAIVIGTGVGGYLVGKKSVKPVTVYVTPIEKEEPQEEAAPEAEAEQEETAEAENN